MKLYFEIALYALLAVAITSATAYYFFYIWSDCLAENAFLTCARMIN